MAIAILAGKTNVFAQSQDGEYKIDFLLTQPHKSTKPNKTPQVSYNPASTVLNVTFPGNWQGGKVEIYRNGAKVVSTNTPAGATLCYMLRNYGLGNYTVIVTSGNTVVYSNCLIVK